jgi:DtxR family Mn-dependent transcriptional regulator
MRCQEYDRLMATSHGVDDYLETIYFLATPIGEYRPTVTGTPTLASRVAEMLGVSRASAGEMLKRLEAEGLIERGERKEALLTAAEAHVHADELGGTFTDEMIERIDEKLGHPERCPHGWPVDPDFEQAENRELQPLSTLEPGQQATIVRLAEHDGDLLHWFYDEGLVPGTPLELRAAEPAAGQFRITINGGEKAISEKAASGLFVKRGA